MKKELLEEINCSTYNENSDELEEVFATGIETDEGETWYVAQSVIENLHEHGYMIVKINEY